MSDVLDQTPVAPPRDAARVRAGLLALFVTVLWSSSWVLIRVGLDDELPPLTFAGLRYGLASVLLIAWTTAKRDRSAVIGHLDRSAWWLLIALGLLMYALTQGAQFVAIDSQPAATTSLLLATTPLVVALSSAALLGEHTTRMQRIGGVIVVAGATIYFAGDLGATAVGLTASIIQLVANAGAALLGRSVNRSERMPAHLVTTVSMTTGAIVLLMTGLVVEGLPHLTWRTILIVVWLAAVNTAAAFTWWNHAQRRLTATESAAINTMMVVQIPILGWVFLAEPLGAAEIAGICVVLVGVLSMRAATPGRRNMYRFSTTTIRHKHRERFPYIR